MDKYRGKNLAEWKEYIKKDKSVGIRTIKYIIVLEEIIEALSQPDVSERSVLLPESEKLCRMNQNFVCNCIDNSRCPNF